MGLEAGHARLRLRHFRLCWGRGGFWRTQTQLVAARAPKRGRCGQTNPRELPTHGGSLTCAGQAAKRWNQLCDASGRLHSRRRRTVRCGVTHQKRPCAERRGRSEEAQRDGAVSSAVERLVYTERVGGSIPSPPTTHSWLLFIVAKNAAALGSSPVFSAGTSSQNLTQGIRPSIPYWMMIGASSG